MHVRLNVVRPPAGPVELFLLQNVQTCSGVHLASYEIATGGTLMRTKTAEAWICPLTPSGAQIENKWRYTCTPPSGHGLSGDKFTFLVFDSGVDEIFFTWDENVSRGVWFRLIRDYLMVSYSRVEMSKYLKMRKLRCLETSGAEYPVTRILSRVTDSSNLPLIQTQ